MMTGRITLHSEPEFTGASGGGGREVVLVVHDDDALFRVVRLELSAQGYDAESGQPSDDLEPMIDALRPACIVILDLSRPGVTAFDVLKRCKQCSPAPVLVATSERNLVFKSVCLELGADDVIAGPYKVTELADRIAIMLQRRAEPPSKWNVTRVGDIEIDFDQGNVRRAGVPLKLTPTEWLLVKELAGHRGEAVAAHTLLTRVWGEDFAEDVRYLEIWIRRLQRKIERDAAAPELIKALPGGGYMLAIDVPPRAGSESVSAG